MTIKSAWKEDMKRIETITPEQEAMIPEYITKWVNMPTKQYSDEEVADVIKQMYKAMGEQEPMIFFFDSPLACELVGNTFKRVGKQFSQLDSQLYSQLRSQLYSQLGSQLDSQLGSQLYSQLGSQLDSQLDSQLGSQLYSQLDSQLYSQLGSQLDSQLGSQLDSQLYSQLDSQLYSQLGSQLYSQLRSQLDSQLYSQLRSQLRSQLDSQLGSQLYSQKLEYLGLINVWWASWSGYYDYAQFIGVEFDNRKLNLFNTFNERVIYCCPLKSACIVTRKPVKILWKKDKLHAEGEKAVEFGDGWGWYAHEGVVLPEHIGTFKPSEWKAEWVLESDRADMRALLVAGMGPQRFIEGIGGKCIDKSRHISVHSVEGPKEQVIELYEPDWNKFNPQNKFRVLHLQCPSTRKSHWHWVFPNRDQYPGKYGEKLKKAGVPVNIDTTIAAYQCLWHGKKPEEWAMQA